MKEGYAERVKQMTRSLELLQAGMKISERFTFLFSPNVRKLKGDIGKKKLWFANNT